MTTILCLTLLAAFTLLLPGLPVSDDSLSTWRSERLAKKKIFFLSFFHKFQKNKNERGEEIDDEVTYRLWCLVGFSSSESSFINEGWRLKRLLNWCLPFMATVLDDIYSGESLLFHLEKQRKFFFYIYIFFSFFWGKIYFRSFYSAIKCENCLTIKWKSIKRNWNCRCVY